MRFIRGLLCFVRNQEWVNEPRWLDEDEKAWTSFLATPTGQKLSLILLNLTLRQNASAVLKKPEALADASGYAKGFRGCVAILESLATRKFNSAIPNGDKNESDETVTD